MSSPFSIEPVTLFWSANDLSSTTANPTQLRLLEGVSGDNFQITVQNRHNFGTTDWPSTRLVFDRDVALKMITSNANIKSYLFLNGELVWSTIGATTTTTPTIFANTPYVLSFNPTVSITTTTPFLAMQALALQSSPISTFTGGVIQSLLQANDQVSFVIDNNTSKITFTFTDYPVSNLNSILAMWLTGPLLIDTNLTISVQGQPTSIFPNGQTTTMQTSGQFLTGVLTPVSVGLYSGVIIFQMSSTSSVARKIFAYSDN